MQTRYILVFFFCLYSIGSIAQEYKLVENEIVLPAGIRFKSGSSILSDTDKKILLTIKNFLIEKKYVSALRIEGHVSIDQKNAQKLSEERAMAIAQWLIKEGIDCKRIVVVGFGATKPIAEASDVEHNTRINFVIAGLLNKLVGGIPADGGGKIVGDPCNN